MREKPIAAVIYHMFPHYRAPVIRALAGCSEYQFEFHGSHQPVEGIIAFKGDESVRIQELSFKGWRGLGWFKGLFRAIVKSRARAVILIGNPNYPQTWLAALVAKLLGKRVLFWTHGWLRPEGYLKAKFRNCYFNLSDSVLVYDDRAIELASRSGFPSRKVRPIYNSLDWDAAQPLFTRLSKEGLTSVRKRLGIPLDATVLICTARLTPICRFDLLLDAASKLNAEQNRIKVVLIGDGPERPPLELLAKELGLDAQFLGAIYDEAVLADWLYAADITVSPGKVGLTAMHSLTYGTPVVTHSDRDLQMPEVEAVRPGVNGTFFEPGNSDSLAAAITALLDDKRSRKEIRDACRSVMEDRYTPQAQRRRIVAVLNDLLRA